MTETVEVLFVDDDLDAARAFADLINRDGIRTSVANNRARALEIVDQRPIAVAVLDQRMPDISGTELYALLKVKRPYLKAIMLSGEAERNDVSSALEAGYIADVSKTNLDGLFPAILRAYREYKKDMGRSIDRPILLHTVGLNLPYMPRAEYWLMGIEQLREPHVPDTLWRVVGEVNAGESLEIEMRVEVTSGIKFEKTLEHEGSLEFSAKAKLHAEISGKIRETLKTKVTAGEHYAQSYSKSVKKTISLPAEPVNPREEAVKARIFRSGPEFAIFRLALRKKVFPIRAEMDEWVDVSIFTGRIAHKQQDVLTDGTVLERATYTE
ncbi:MAG: response regulator [Caulobacteraceae bacterium]|nr:response regulator [Caulobacteraceae bacterium]